MHERGEKNSTCKCEEEKAERLIHSTFEQEKRIKHSVLWIQNACCRKILKKYVSIVKISAASLY